jgi:hypothetical protein
MMQVCTTSSSSSSGGPPLVASGSTAAVQEPSQQGRCRMLEGLQLCALCSSETCGQSSQLRINSWLLQCQTVPVVF